jgi:hypothetical protein
MRIGVVAGNNSKKAFLQQSVQQGGRAHGDNILYIPWMVVMVQEDSLFR